MAIANVELTDGVTSLRPRGSIPRLKVLGQKAPRSGFPDLDWTRNTAVLTLAFRPGESGQRL